MFDNLVKELKDELAGKLTQIPDLNSDKLDAIFDIAGKEVTKQVGSQLLSGNVSTLTNLFSKQENNSSANSLMNSLSQGITNQLVSKLGFNNSTAGTIVKMILPAIIEKITAFNSQTPDDDDSPLRKLFGGGDGDKGDSASGIGGLLNKFF